MIDETEEAARSARRPRARRRGRSVGSPALPPVGGSSSTRRRRWRAPTVADHGRRAAARAACRARADDARRAQRRSTAPRRRSRTSRSPIRQGEVLALIGPVGLRQDDAAAHAQPPHRADPERAPRRHASPLDGRDIDTLEVTELRRRVSMVFQQPNPFPMSIFDNVAYALREQATQAPGQVRRSQPLVESRRCGAPASTTRSRDDLDRPALRLSGGQQQRLCIARAIADAARGAAHGRAVLGAGPALDRGDRGADRRAAQRAGDRDRHAQPAAGLPRRRPRRVHVPRRPRRVRRPPSRSSARRAPSARATTSGVRSGDAAPPRRLLRRRAGAVGAARRRRSSSAQRAKQAQEARSTRRG